MMYMVRCGIVRTGGCDGCGAEGARVTAMPEEHEDMPRGGEDGVSRRGEWCRSGRIYIYRCISIYMYICCRGREGRERGGLTGGERADGSAR